MMVGFENVVLVVLVWYLSLGFTRCAVLRDGSQFDTKDIVDPWNYWGTVSGRPKLKVQPGKFVFQMEEIKTLAGDLHEDGYQAGWRMVQDAPMSVAGGAVPVSDEVRKILASRPRVECADDSVSLKLHGSPAAYESGLSIDQDAGPPLPLSKIPSGCGVQVHRRWWGLILTVPFVGCFGAQESDLYTLPIHLSGLPAKLSCPLTSLESKLFSVVCNSSGMTMKTPKATLVDHLWVNVKNEWLPVLKAAVRCNFSIMSESDGLVLSSPYEPCMESKDGTYSLHIAAEKEIQLFCPAPQPTSSPSPTVGIAIGSEPGPVDAGTSNPSSSPPFEGAQPTMLPTTSLPFGPVTDLPNASINPSNQPTTPTTKAPLETGSAVESLGLDLASTPLIPTSSPLEHGLASNLPTTSSPAALPVDWVDASLTPSLAGLPNELPTTSSPATLPVDGWVDAPLTPSLAGLPTEMPTTSSPVPSLPANKWVDAPLIPSLPNEMPTTSSPVASLPANNWVDAPLTPSMAGLASEMPTTSSPVASLPVDNLVNVPLIPTLAGALPTEIPSTSEPASTTTTSLPQRVYGKPQHPYSSKPWYPVYPQKPMLVPNGGSDPEKPKLPGTPSDADSQIPLFPVPPYYMNPYMYSNYFNPVPMSGINYDPRPYWLNQPYSQHGPQQFHISYPVFGPNFSPSSSVPCKSKSCILGNKAPPSTSSKLGGYSPIVGSTTAVGEAKSARSNSMPLKIMKSRLF